MAFVTSSVRKEVVSWNASIQHIIIHVLNLAVVWILFYCVCKFRLFLFHKKWSVSNFYWKAIYRGYYTVARRYEFYFLVAKQYFTNERSEWVKYCFCHEKIKFIFSNRRVMFFLLYRHADDGVFDDFPKISEDFPKLFRRPDERLRTFSRISEDFRRCPKISDDCRRLSRKTRRCFDNTPTNLSTI